MTPDCMFLTVAGVICPNNCAATLFQPTRPITYLLSLSLLATSVFYLCHCTPQYTYKPDRLNLSGCIVPKQPELLPVTVVLAWFSLSTVVPMVLLIPSPTSKRRPWPLEPACPLELPPRPTQPLLMGVLRFQLLLHLLLSQKSSLLDQKPGRRPTTRIPTLPVQPLLLHKEMSTRSLLVVQENLHLILLASMLFLVIPSSSSCA